MVNTYNNLVAAVQASLEDDSTEFASFIPTAVELATARLNREIDTLGLDVTAVVSGSSGARLLSKPSGYLFARNVTFTSNGEIIHLIKQSKSFVEQYWTYGATSVGLPKYYADYNNTQFVLAPTPNAAYNYEITGAFRPVTVSAANQTNYYTANLPDALFHATMVEMCRFARNEGLGNLHEQAYTNVMLGINNEARRARRDESPAPMNPNPNLNTLKGDN